MKQSLVAWFALAASACSGTASAPPAADPSVFHRAGAPIRFYRRSRLRACREAGCPGRIPHDFRRTSVRNLVRAGVTERVAMMLTGHKTRSVFERYNVVSEADTPNRRAVNDGDYSFPVEKLVAREGIEPPTPRFSVVCSTN